MVVEGNRSLNVLSDQPPRSAPEDGSGLGAEAPPSAAIRTLAAGDIVRSQRRGPKTVAGKARIALNALSHGVTSARLVVLGESREAWAEHCQRIAERQDLETASARLLPHPLDIDKVIRYEAHLSRQLYQALHELEAMRAGRRGQAAPLVRVDVHGAPDLIAAAGTLTS